MPKSKIYREDIIILSKGLRGVRNSTIIPEMKFLTFQIPYGAQGRVKVKVRKKNKKMEGFKKIKLLSLPDNKLVNLKLGEFAPTRNFLKHTTKTKKK